MSETSTFDRLLAALPEIAEAVNAFSSESAQLKVLDAVLASLEVPSHTPSRSAASADPSAPPAPPASDSGRRATPRTKGGTGKKEADVKMVPDLNLRPAGKTSLREFVDAKSPSTNEELYAVIVYYLEHTLALTTITADHVFTSHKELGRKVSPRLRTVLSNSAKAKGWIDTSNREKLRTSISGQNIVEHDLPRKKEK